MKGIAESLRLLREGQDIVAPASVFRLSAHRACTRVHGAPYSVADNIAHAELWQRHWLAKLGRGDSPQLRGWNWDWPTVPAAEWPEVRRRFLEGLDSAIEIAEEGNPDHEFVLNQILIHDTYHVGQCVLLKRMLG